MKSLTKYLSREIVEITKNIKAINIRKFCEQFKALEYPPPPPDFDQEK